MDREPDPGIAPSAWADGKVRKLASALPLSGLSGVLTTEGGASEAPSKKHLGRCGSGLAAWVGESATAMGSGHPGGSTPTCALDRRTIRILVRSRKGVADLHTAQHIYARLVFIRFRFRFRVRFNGFR